MGQKLLSSEKRSLFLGDLTSFLLGTVVSTTLKFKQI